MFIPELTLESEGAKAETGGTLSHNERPDMSISYLFLNLGRLLSFQMGKMYGRSVVWGDPAAEVENKWKERVHVIHIYIIYNKNGQIDHLLL